MVKIAITIEELEILINADSSYAIKVLEELKQKMQEIFSKTSTPTSFDELGKNVEKTTKNIRDNFPKLIESSKQRVVQLGEEARLSEIIKRALDRETVSRNQLNSTYNVKPRTAIVGKSLTATEIIAQKELRNESSKTSADQLQNFNLLQKVSMQYYAKLDLIKKTLASMGLYGKEIGDPINKSIKSITPNLKNLTNEIKKTTSKGISMFNRLGTTIANTFRFVVVYKSIRGLFSFLRDSILNAINVSEIENLFQVALGNLSSQATDFALTLKNAFGLDVYVSKNMIATFQNMITSMSITEKTALKMSKSLTLLANDMASLYNIDPQQAFENLQSALTGQGKAVRKYGYIITESILKEVAWRNGIAETGVELTEQQKVVARYTALLEQSGNAQGDLSRTLNTLSNQLRIMKQRIVTAGRSLGEVFIPFIQATLPFINTFFVLLERLGNVLTKFSFSLFGIDYIQWKKDQEMVIKNNNNMVTSEEDYTDSIKETQKAQKGLLSGFDKLNISQRKNQELDKPSIGSPEFDVPELSVPEIAYPNGKNPFEEMADAFIKSIQKMQKLFQPFLTNVGNGFKWIYDNALKPIINWTGNKLLPQFFKSLASVLNSETFAKVGKSLAYIWDKFLKPVSTWAGDKFLNLLKWIEKNGETTAKIITALATSFIAFKLVKGVLKIADSILGLGIAISTFSKLTLGGKALSIFGKSIPNLSKIFGKSSKELGDATATLGKPKKGLFSGFKKIGHNIIGIFTALGNKIMPIITSFGSKIVPILYNQIAKIIPAMTSIGTKLAPVIVGIGSKLGSVLLKALPITGVAGLVATSIGMVMKEWDTIVYFFTDQIPWVLGQAKLKWNEFWTDLKPKFEEFKSNWMTGWNNIKNNFSTVWDNIKNKFNELWNPAIEKFNSFKEKWILGWETIKNGSLNLWTDLKTGFSDMINGWIKNLINFVTNIIPNFVKNVIGAFGNLFTGKSYKKSELPKTQNKNYDTSSFNIPRMAIPKLAKGGVVSKPRIVEVGEYSNASSNPEIITPQNILYETSMKANEPLIALLKELILNSRNSGNQTIELDGRILGRTISKIQKNNNYLMGV